MKLSILNLRKQAQNLNSLNRRQLAFDAKRGRAVRDVGTISANAPLAWELLRVLVSGRSAWQVDKSQVDSAHRYKTVP